jgi:hypothetical protein
MTKWEYKLHIIECHLSPILKLARWGTDTPEGPVKDFDKVQAYINRLGEESWELVSAVNGTDHNGVITKVILFLRRPKA